MHFVELLHEYIKKALPTIHKIRLKRLLTTVACLLIHAELTLTSLGRKTSGLAHVKHKIKAVDRLLGNDYLYGESFDIYCVLAAKTIGNLQDIDVLVDWSSVGNHENHMLRASIVFNDRAVTIYQEVHPEKLLGNYKVHKSFLKRLKKVIPSNCRVNIITDAGFRTEWFELVQKNLWDFTGRIMSNMQYQASGAKWKACSSLYKKATGIPQYIGNILLAKTRGIQCEAYLYAEYLKTTGKRKKKHKIKFGRDTKEYRKKYRTPWLLVTSKKHCSNNAKKIVKKYSRRMKIEHDFRDTKDPKCGLGLNHTKTRDRKRLTILLLIASLALYLLWLIGVAAEQKSMQYRFQANSVKSKRILSLVFLGLQVIEHCIGDITSLDFRQALQQTHYLELKEAM